MDIDYGYEEDVSKNPNNFLSWWQYLQAKIDVDEEYRFWIYERALVQVPGSYKLWYNYLMEKKQWAAQFPVDHENYEKAIDTFQRALYFMHKMPRIWLEFLNFLMQARRITLTRRSFDLALRALPVTQHYRIWPLYIKFAKQPSVPQETSIRIFRRYLKVEKEQVEEFIDYLIDIKEIGEATRLLYTIINDERFISRQGRTKHDLWMMLCDLGSKYPDQLTIRLEPIIRSGIQKFKSEIGRLWVSLAQFYIRLGSFAKAHDIFEEGIQSVITIRDFALIYEAYSEFLYGMVSSYVERRKNKEGKITAHEQELFELTVARYDHLLERQPLLTSDVLLRQNPHSVNEWHNRISLFEDKPKKQVDVFTQALNTVDPQRTSGNLHSLWTRFAHFWEHHGQLESARKVFRKATKVSFKRADHLASVWCEYIEMELRHGNFQEARKLAQEATAIPPNYKSINKLLSSIGGQEITAQQKLFRQIRIWSLYVDLEESFGTYESVKAIYEKIIDIKIATPLLILNYAKILEEKHLYEDSFRVYEKGVDIFKFPHVLDIWTTYLTKFIDHYKGTKLERARDLFEQAVESAPQEYVMILYLMYAEFEEEYGMARHTMSVYDRATRAVPDDQKSALFNVYIAKAAQFFGITRTREVFEKAIETLPSKFVPKMCLRYAKLERRLGEIERARAIYAHGAQLCDPRMNPTYWKTWKEFEETYGDIDTFKEVLRIRRSVAVQYNSGVSAPVGNT